MRMRIIRITIRINLCATLGARLSHWFHYTFLEKRPNLLINQGISWPSPASIVTNCNNCNSGVDNSSGLCHNTRYELGKYRATERQKNAMKGVYFCDRLL